MDPILSGFINIFCNHGKCCRIVHADVEGYAVKIQFPRPLLNIFFISFLSGSENTIGHFPEFSLLSRTFNS